MEAKKKLLRVGELPPQMKALLLSIHPEATGFLVEETELDHNLLPVGGQTKQQGLLIAGYQHRGTGELLFRVVDTENNWSTHWYKALSLTSAEVAS